MNIVELLTFSVEHRASDLHLSSGRPPMMRIDGELRAIKLPALEQAAVLALVHEVMNERQRRDYEESFEVDFSFDIQGVARFRVIPLRVPTLEALGTPRVFEEIVSVPRGLVLVTGPTGSGKSTTLAARIDHLNDRLYAHILTIEDPIEFVHTGRKCLINQREVRRDTLDFGAALREDPDIILVGEMRDLETIRLALTAAETGHLVLATLHTSSAAKTIDRIIDVFPTGEKNMARSLLSESLRAVIAQTLLKRIDGGRVAAYEIMIATPAIRNLIREDKVAQMYSAIQTGQALGMRTMDQDLQELLRRGLVAREEAEFQARTN